MLLRTTVLEIAGMRSARCAQLVYTALAGVEGARAAQVVVGRAEVEHEAGVAAEALAEAVASVGYAVTRAETRAAGLPVL